ncbi:hypothetical protein F442_14645 [Phytophthora nicotianae P10297]|uniref:SH3 domain-containing protein n=1 Tax=Phytophthora nicotianae P10297 TaxID=1317064 RepID=W2YUC8_PHYNI|nr:hypothetical protein F442_14645 [Phytophthora nicotianae P10297]
MVIWVVLNRENMAPVSNGVAGYRYDAQDDTQLTIYPGDEVAILEKDDDGWWICAASVVTYQAPT